MSSHDYVYIVTETPINLLEVDLSPATYEARLMRRCSACAALSFTGGSLSAAVEAVRAIYPDARATTSREEAGEWLRHRITPHKGGCTVKRSTDVTPQTQARLEELRQAGISPATWWRKQHSASCPSCAQSDRITRSGPAHQNRPAARPRPSKEATRRTKTHD